MRNFNFLGIAVLIALSCSSYAPIRIVKHIDLSSAAKAPGTVRGAGTAEADVVDERDASGTADGKWEERKGRRTYKAYQRKYLAYVRSCSPVARINNRGVEYAIKGEFNEARILFSEAVKESADMGAAYNNLAVVLEIYGREDEAFAMYARACMLEPGNEYFRKNMLYAVESTRHK